jgi:hypothetical protein
MSHVTTPPTTAPSTLSFTTYGTSHATPKFKKGRPKWKYWKLFKMNVPRLHSYLVEKLKPMYSKMEICTDFIYAKGDIPIMLVAHMDTVHTKVPRVEQDGDILWSSTGLGADDRAGVAAIMEILSTGLRPHVLFTDKEEIGGEGARVAASKLEAPDVNFIIELDRRGENDSVYYSNDNEDFQNYIDSFGFKFSYGSFSDISILCPRWKISGVNLSIGYYGAHTRNEFLDLGEWGSTVDKVIAILNAPLTEKYEYVAKKYTYYYGNTRYPLSSFSYDKYDDDIYAETIDCDALADGITINVADALDIYMPLEDLTMGIGGTPEEWINFITENAEEIEQIISEEAFYAIYNLAERRMPDFLWK